MKTMDLRKQKGMQIANTNRILQAVDGWSVPSQTSSKRYFVRKDYTCTCPDHKERQCRCKHAYAVEYFLQKVTTTEQGVKVETKKVYSQDWKAYNQAQTNEVNMFDKLLRDLVETVEEPERNGAGRPNLSLKEQLFCSTQKVYSQLSSRRAKSLYNNSNEKGLLGKSPHANSVNKFLNREEVTPILHKLISLSSAPLKSVESKFAVDSSGFRTTRFYEYCRDKHKVERKHAYIKAHILCGTKTNTVCSVQVTPENGADTVQFVPLLQDTANNGFAVEEITADKAYNSITNYNTAKELGANAYIPFKSNITATVRSGNRGKFWRKMFHYFKANEEEFLQHYHARSNVETVFHMVKTKFGDSVKSKNWVAQQNELLAKILCHNIVVLIHEMYELGIQAQF